MRVLLCRWPRLRTALWGSAAVALLLACLSLLDGKAAAPVLAEPYYCGPTDSPYISLAINVDWGNEYLPAMLAALAENQVTATFFLTGRWCHENPALAAEIAAAGHEIGNHGYSHASPNASSQSEIIEEIRRTEAEIEAACGVTTSLYAPPSGEREDHVLAAAGEAGYTVVLWSVDTIDWQGPDAATIIQRVCSKIEQGGVILAHPTAGTAAALPELLPKLQEAGYVFAPVSANLGL